MKILPIPEAEFKKYYPTWYHKSDKGGRPVYFELTGALNVPTLLKYVDPPKLLRYYVANVETVQAKM